MHGDNIEESYKQDTVSNIEFEAIVTSIKKYLFHQCMVDFVNKIELSDQKYHTNGNVIDENHKGELLLPMKYFVSFGTDFQSMYFMSAVFLKDKIHGVRITKFQLAYIRKMVKLCWVVHYIWWGNEYLELKEWEDCIKSNKK